MGKIKFTCEEATTICTKSQYKEASFLEKLKLQFHLIYCKKCRMFSRQNSSLSDMCAVVKEKQELNQELGLNEAFKLQLQQKLNEGLEKES